MRDETSDTSEACDRESCYCCGKGHFCEPDYYPTALGQTWTCPECGLWHEAYDVHAAHLDARWLRYVQQGTLGWRGIRKSA